MNKPVRKDGTDTIPKLDQVNYLFETLGLISEQASFDDIRQELIRMLPEARRERARARDAMFWSNVRDSLRELMKLGLVEKAALPSRTNQLDAHRSRKFLLTEAGAKFLELERRDAWEFRDRFAQAMLIAHPYLRELYRLLGSQELFFPRIQKSEIPGDVEAWRSGPPALLEGLTAFLGDAIQQVMDKELRITGLGDRMRPYLISAWKRLDTRQKAHALSQAVVKTFNDVAIRVLLQGYGQRMDYVTFRSAVGLLSDLSAIWNTRSLRDRRGWTIWATSAATIPNSTANRSPGDEALQGGVWFKRRAADHDAVREALMTNFFSLPGRRGGFALIHELRAQVCYRMKIHGHDFDSVLRRLHSQSLVDESYAINLDRGGADELPPSEEPFRIGGRAFYLITLLKRE
ncbi:hypothetical protein NKI12_14295 [Mesorhizobium australicum]|uniref:Uncharacterized protein n=1 Tax=Mesorhizobium australicum TaxID=536018 RepID=A0ACC6T130_9HYPH